MGKYNHRYRNRRVRPTIKSKPIPGHKDYGDGIEDGKFYECQYCGYTCDIDKDALGGLESKGGATYADADDRYSENEPPFYSGIDGQNKTLPLASLLSLRSAHIVMESDADGTESTIRRNWYNDGGTGCPFCHSTNWKG